MAQKQTLTGTMIKVMVLTIGIIVIMLIRANVGDLVAYSERILNGGSNEPGAVFATAESYTEAQQEELKKQFMGFWSFEGEVENGVYYSDLIEIKENGITWQYETSIVPFPYNDKDTLVRVNNSYLLPFQAKDTVGTRSDCYLKLIRQNWVIDGVPCYGKSKEVLDNMFNASTESSDIISMWDVERMNDSILVINGLGYKKYTGNIYEFFHTKAVEAIESIDDISVQGCSGEDPHLQWMRDRIIASVKSQELEPGLVALEQKMNLKKFYVPLCLNRLPVNYGGSEGKSITISITLSPEGSVVSAEVKGDPVKASPRLRQLLTDEIKQWILHGTGVEQTIEITVPAKSRI